MLQFIVALVIALFIGALLAALILQKKNAPKDADAKNLPDRHIKDLKHPDTHLEKLEQLSKLTGELAHEIKNPLSTIKINLRLAAEELEVAQTEPVPQQAAQRCKRAVRKLNVIEKEADRLEQILDGFLRYVDRTELQLAHIDINELIGDIVDFYSPQALSHSITLRHSLYPQPLICNIDAGMLKQAVLNLFINAQQALGKDGELMVKTDTREKQALIHISDTGTGIAPDKLSRIFEPYYSSRPQGTGLGLPTAKKLIEAHNGAITVDSEIGKGTSFMIKLPLVTERKS